MEAILGLLNLGKLALIGSSALERAKDRDTYARVAAVMRSWPDFSTDDERGRQLRVQWVIDKFETYLGWNDVRAARYTKELEETHKTEQEMVLAIITDLTYLGDPPLCVAFLDDPEKAQVVWRSFATAHHELRLRFMLLFLRWNWGSGKVLSEPVAAESVLASLGPPWDYPPPSRMAYLRTRRVETLLLSRETEDDNATPTSRGTKVARAMVASHEMLLLDLPPEKRWSVLDAIVEEARLPEKWGIESDLLRNLEDAEVRHAWYDDPPFEGAVVALLKRREGESANPTQPFASRSGGSTLHQSNYRVPCPWCAEPIMPEAKVCRFCGRDVAGNKGPAS